MANIYPANLQGEEDAIRDKLLKDLEAKLRSKVKIDYPLLAGNQTVKRLILEKV